MRPARLLALTISLLLLGTVACGGSDSSAFSVTEKDFKVDPSKSHLEAGSTTFTVHNKGKQEHELVVFRTDLPEDKLPLNKDKSRVDEEGKGITHLDPEAEGVKVGKSKTITIDLKKGRYVFICNLTGHYVNGMHAVVTVG